jgi:hypothetical protein
MIRCRARCASQPLPGSQPCPQPVARRGVTLLELILAISLGLLLIGGIYAAIDQSARQANIGKVEIERLQIARAVLRRIELDLRAAMFSVETAISDGASVGANSVSTEDSESDSGADGESEEDSGTGLSEGTSGTSDGSTTTTIVADEDSESVWTGSLGIRGTANELWIDLSHSRRSLSFTTSAVNAVSDLKTVTYFLSNSSQPAENLEASPVMVYDADGIGLGRSEGDRSILRAANAAGGALPGTAQVLAPEINQLQFRYFDGVSWSANWDSATSGALPRAVEITIGFEAPENVSGYLGNSEVSPTTQTFRLVVAIPVSDPLPAEDF